MVEQMDHEAFEQAADWYDRRDELSSDECSEFIRWLQDEKHRTAYETIARHMDSPELQQGMAQFGEFNLDIDDHIELSNTSKKPTPHEASTLNRYLGMAASFALVSIATLLFYTGVVSSERRGKTNDAVDVAEQNVLPTPYTTDTAIRTTLTLADGSELLLDASSSIVFASTPKQRQVYLEAGQVLFDIAREDRPFVISIDQSTVEVLGTVFDIDHLGDKTIVRVYEGLVSVNADRELRLKAGESVVITKNTLGHIKNHRSQARSWQQGWLEITSEPLDEVIDRFQRYVDKPFIINSSVDKDHLISGRFNLDTPEDSLELLAHVSDVTVEEQENSITISR